MMKAKSEKLKAEGEKLKAKSRNMLYSEIELVQYFNLSK